MLNFKKTIMLGLIIALFTLPAMFFVQGCRSGGDFVTVAPVTDGEVTQADNTGQVAVPDKDGAALTKEEANSSKPFWKFWGKSSDKQNAEKDEKVQELIADGDLYLKKKEYEKAKQYFQDALEIAPDNETAQKLLTVAQYHIEHPAGTKDGEQSLAILEKSKNKESLKRQAINAEKKALFEAANNFAEQRRFQAAIDTTDRLLSVDPDNEQAKYLRNMYEQAQQWQIKHDSARGADGKVAMHLIDADTSLIPPTEKIEYPTAEGWRNRSSRGVVAYDVGGMGGSAGANQNSDMFDFSYQSNKPVQWYSLGKAPVNNQIVLNNFNADELWVIAKADMPADDTMPRSGCCVVMLPEKDHEVPLPLKHTDVKGNVSGYIATVEVVQQFHNPYDTKIEAKYVFPLPHNAAVNDFLMTVGDRTIRGVIREKEEAKQIYQAAKSQGHVASLLTQQRPNIFTQKVANIEPGKAIDINIKYFNTLEYKDGWYEFVFPMVVGPRFNPAHITDGVGAVAYGSPEGSSGQETEVQYLKPDQRSGHDISLAVDIDAGVKIEDIECTSHVIEKKFNSGSRVNVQIASNDSIPNKDFVLRYKVSGSKVKTGIMTTTDANGSYFTMMLYPPESISQLKRVPMEMIFVLDCSGSMNGFPIELSKKAIRRALKRLGPDDSFQIIRFSNNASQLGPKPIVATKENIEKGLAYIDTLNSGGGTRMVEGVKAALDFEHDPKRFRIVSFMTDGFIGNEDEILQAISEKLGASRIFSFGIGSSPNRYLLDRMAAIGQGAVSYIGNNDSPIEPVDNFYETIAHPALTDIKIDFGDMAVSEVWPPRVPDLFAGRAVVITGKCENAKDCNITVSGKVGSLGQEYVIPAEFSDETRHDGIAAIWARKKIEILNNMLNSGGPQDIATDILTTALNYNLMSKFTSFVAVDSATKTQGDHGVTVNVGVPVPDGVKYETTVN